MEIYNPEAMRWNTSTAFLHQPLLDMTPPEVKSGGVYALYYSGDLEKYESIRGMGVPIYVGHSKKDISRRVWMGCKHVDDADNLNRQDFKIRVLLLPSEFTSMIKDVLIERFHQPFWNRPEYKGFGGDCSPRVGWQATNWDKHHSGRQRALEYNRTGEDQTLFEAKMADRFLQEEERLSLLGSSG